MKSTIHKFFAGLQCTFIYSLRLELVVNRYNETRTALNLEQKMKQFKLSMHHIELKKKEVLYSIVTPLSLINKQITSCTVD